ncbi:hypothetical protein PTSG_02453 [Salpingoeca rosetta]|uniref:MAGE domain-containing protein n=1 Tax=Salpingoeca rosetta (strain ATCC 50818 / BSB-021) TaxID=946362 RepID=F2U289_SALR5|nr:uncharacterized protein PTSG_02453 [Salpingoeca rosetta]EGD81741.1 hypothetical protein PTSG_02453 [Salpingoeca rosetta]|eukprot:XP_004996945.1 hypothetical protein PTSG_02453 [Salpingoeca rosetta]
MAAKRGAAAASSTQPAQASIASQAASQAESQAESSTQPAKRSKSTAPRRAYISLSEGEKTRAVESAARAILFRCCYQGKAVKRTDVLQLLGLTGAREAFFKGAGILNELFGLKLTSLPLPDQPDSMPSMGMKKPTEEKPTGLFTLVNRLQSDKVPASAHAAGEGNAACALVLDESTQAQWGFLMTILATIYVNKPKHEISQSELWKFLRERLGVGNTTRIGGERADRLIDTVFASEQRYLVRLRMPNANPNEPVTYFYRWGPRARVELSEYKILQFLAKIYGHDFAELAEQLNLDVADGQEGDGAEGSEEEEEDEEGDDGDKEQEEAEEDSAASRGPSSASTRNSSSKKGKRRQQQRQHAKVKEEEEEEEQQQSNRRRTTRARRSRGRK